MKYKTPVEAGIAPIPPAPKRKPYSKHKRTPPSERYMIRLKKGQTLGDYLAAKRAQKGEA